MPCDSIKHKTRSHIIKSKNGQYLKKMLWQNYDTETLQRYYWICFFMISYCWIFVLPSKAGFLLQWDLLEENWISICKWPSTRDSFCVRDGNLCPLLSALVPYLVQIQVGSEHICTVYMSLYMHEPCCSLVSSIASGS